MSKNNLINKMKSAAIDAQYRVSADQTSNLAQKSIQQLIASGNFNTDQIKAIELFMETPMAKAIISFSIGMTINNLPEDISGDPRAKRLAEEFTSGGMALAMNTAIGTLVSDIVPKLTGTLSALPEPTRVQPIVSDSGITSVDVNKKSLTSSK